MSNKKKTITAAVAVATAGAILLGGTFAWQSINQTALNEASDVINPGGRLHDDFDGENKDVYVENFAKDPIYARVRLDEYFEIIMNKGTAVQTVDVITTYMDDNGNTMDAVRGETDTWPTHIFGGTNATDEYWNWTTGGSTVYMPTFNMNKDSLEADINGTYAGPDRDTTTEEDAYKDYVSYTDGETLTGTEIYDADANGIDEFVEGTEELNVTYKEVEADHTAQSTLDATLMSMQEWIDAGSQPGEYWVYDTDGWVYWAQAIQPGTATGLLLDEIGLTQVMDDSWYYAINVVAQFITADDLGKTDGTGFYDAEKGTAPSADALALLKAIGVDTLTPEEKLEEAFAAGGDIEIDGTITATADEKRDDLSFQYELLWTEGGTVSGGTLNLEGKTFVGLFINNENNWPEAEDGANKAILKNTTINSADTVAVYAQAIDAPITLENVTITGDYAGVYAEHGSETVTLNNVTIDASKVDHIEGYDWYNSAVAAATNANVVINSGSYTGENAVYVFSSGATITINGGYFEGALKADADRLIIQGGTFTDDPTAFVADGYEVVTNEDGTYTVQKEGGSSEGGETYEILEIELNTDTYWLYKDITPGNYKLQFSPADYVVSSIALGNSYTESELPQLTQDEDGNYIMTVTEDHDVVMELWDEAHEYSAGYNDLYFDVGYTTADGTSDTKYVGINVKTDTLKLFMSYEQLLADDGVYEYNRGMVIGTEDTDATWSLSADSEIAGLTLEINEYGYRSIEWDDVYNKYDPYPCTLTVTSGDQSITITLNLLSLDWDSDS